MKREHQAFLGFMIIAGLIIGYALFADALKNQGAWLWIPVVIIIVGNIGAAIKLPQYRRWLGLGIKYGFEAIAEYFTGSSRSGSERKAVPRPIQRRVVARASGRCQYPRCQERGRSRLDIHHIDMDPSHSHDEDNLVLVCPNHHRQIHNDPDITTRQVRSWARRRIQPSKGRS